MLNLAGDTAVCDIQIYLHCWKVRKTRYYGMRISYNFYDSPIRAYTFGGRYYLPNVRKATKLLKEELRNIREIHAAEGILSDQDARKLSAEIPRPQSIAVYNVRPCAKETLPPAPRAIPKKLTAEEFRLFCRAIRCAVKEAREDYAIE